MNIETIQNDFVKNVTNIFLYVIFNWGKISQNRDIMNVLDVNTNSMCKKLKIQNPNMRDEFVQAHVYTLLLMMIFMTMIPITDVLKTNLQDYVLNDINITESINNDDVHDSDGDQKYDNIFNFDID